MSTLTLSAEERDTRDVLRSSLIVMTLSALALVILGIFMVFSATAPSSIRSVDADPTQQLFSTAIRQAIFAVIGIVGALILARISPAFLRKFASIIFIVGLLLQLAVIFFGTGVAGNTNWLSIGPVSLQPSEFLKLALIMWMADRLARLPDGEIDKWGTIWLPTLGFCVAVGLVLGGGDVGTALTYGIIGVGMLWVAGVRARMFIVPGIVAAVGAGILVAIRPSRFTRVADYFSNLFTLPDAIAPTQADYALYAFGTGGWAGVGVGAGKEKWRDLAAAHTDFIFAVIGEELGFFGVLAVIALFMALGWALMRICVHHPDRYAQLLAAGAAFWLCGQAIANMFVVTGLLPVFGVPLPFVSMGGSSMMANLFMIGIVAATVLVVPGVRETFQLSNNLASRATAIIRRKG